MGNTIDFNIRVDSDIKKQSEASMIIIHLYYNPYTTICLCTF